MIWQVLFNGIVAGAFIALIALGYTLIYGVARLINFAHGDVMTASAYVFLLLVERHHWPLLIAFLCALFAGALLALLIEYLAVRPAAGTGDRLAPVISTLGAGVILQAGLGLLFGPSARPVPAGRLLDSIRIGQVQTTPAQLMTLVGGIALAAGLLLFLHRHRYGQAMRAIADDARLAETVGMNPRMVTQIAFAFSGALAAVAGIAVGMDTSLRPTMGYALGFTGFTAAILGGMGNPSGAVLGALLVGLVSSITGTYLQGSWQPAYILAALAITLLFRPQGLLPGRRVLTD